MTSCKEYYLDDILAITAIPLADLTVGTLAWQLSPTISEDDFYPTLDNAITIGIQPATEGGILIPIIRNTGKAKDSESDSVAGRLHTVSITCDVDDREGIVWNDLLKLERNPFHLALLFRGGQHAFVSATEDNYLCNAERDGSKTTVTFRIQNLMGIQLIM